MKIEISKILPNPQQPRSTFDQAELETLAASIRERGLINPIAVEENGDSYIVIDGERRLRASKLAGLTEIEASVRPGMNGTGAQERLVMALVANIQRSDMNAIDEGKAYQAMRKYMSTDDIAKAVGVSISTILGRMKLLEYEPEIQDLIASGKFSAEARVKQAMDKLPDSETRVKMARSFAMRQASSQSILASCSRIVMTGVHGPKFVKSAVPVIELMRSKVKDWNSLMLVHAAGLTVDLARIDQIAGDTCKACALYDVASTNTCRDCPAVDLLRRLVEIK